MNLWVYTKCSTTRYLQQAYYYGIPLINICPAVNLCFGRSRLPKNIIEEYSLTDGIHPWGKKGVSFIGGIIYSWWSRYDEIISEEVHERTAKYFVQHSSSSSSSSNSRSHNNRGKSESVESSENNNDNDNNNNDRVLMLPVPLYADAPVGACTRCEAMTGDSGYFLSIVLIVDIIIVVFTVFIIIALIIIIIITIIIIIIIIIISIFVIIINYYYYYHHHDYYYY